MVINRFQAIEHAEVDLQSGLNVLYGPNDIGKSTLATAIRAALLLPTGSAEGDEYVSWQGDYTPEVQLTLCDSKGVQYRVTKSFGATTRASAKLERSRDGVNFDIEATGRQVEEKLRALIDWGIPAPGGKTGGKRGLPQAFLSRVLLGEQTDVDAILNSSFEDDPAESGRLRLTAALQAFAQDPRFKSVLDQAQARVDELFTPTGQRKRGRGSPFLAAAEEVKDLQSQLQQLQERRGESDRAETRVKEVLAQVQAVRERHEDERERLHLIETHLRMAEARSQATAELTKAEEALRAIDEQWDLVRRKGEELGALEEQLEGLKSGLELAERQVESAKTAMDVAAEALRRETSDEAALARRLRTAEIENSIAKLDGRLSDLHAAEKDVDEAIRRSAAVAALETAREAKERERVDASGKADVALKAAAEATASLQRLDELKTYARWVEAQEKVSAAVAASSEVDKLEGRSAELEADVSRMLAEAAAIAVPAADEVNAIEQLDRDLAMAEAALGGGLSLGIRAAEGVDLRLRADGKPAATPALGETLEAARTVELAIPGVLELEIFAGDAEARKRAEALRRRWIEEARPLLEKAGVSNAGELRAARSRADDLLRSAANQTRERESVQKDALALRAKASGLEELRVRVIEFETAIDGYDRVALTALYQSLGQGWETQLEKTRKALDEQRHRSTEELVAARSQAGRLEGEISQLEGQLTAAKRALTDALRKVPGDGEPAVELATIKAEAEQFEGEKRRLQTDLTALAQSGSDAADAARQREEEARTALASAESARKKAAEAAEQHRSILNRAQGEYGILKGNAEGIARAPALQDVQRTKAALETLPVPPTNVTPEERDQAAQRVEHLAVELRGKKDELLKAEATLTHVGGAVVADQCEEVRNALDDALCRQKSLETDAQAWRLLHDVLQESEGVGAKHLGKMLGDDVGRRFQDLTNQRYGTLELGPSGQTLGIHAAGSARSVSALSVGTREQLATLLRLAIAESLGSAILLDDHLVEADPERLQWFVDVLRRSAERIQVIVLTCRRRDYEPAGDSTVAWVDADQAIRRWQQPSSGRTASKTTISAPPARTTGGPRTP